MKTFDIKSGRLTIYGILCWKIDRLRKKLFWTRKDFAEFLYDLRLNLMGKRNSFEYIKEYFRVVANSLVKIGFYNGDDRAQRVEQWKHIADTHLKNICFMGRNCDEKLSYYWRYWHLQPRNQLTYKDYIYALESCNLYLCKQYHEVMYYHKCDSIDAQNLPYRQKRKKIIAINSVDSSIWNLDRINVGYLDEIIYNLLKEECKAIVESSYESPYNGISPNNPYYLQLLNGTNGEAKNDI